MTIWYLHQYFRTPEQGGALRSYHLAKALVAQGHEVHMITAHDHPTDFLTTVEGIHVHYLPVPYDQAMGLGSRAQAFWGFVKMVLAWSKKHPKPDFVYATSTPLTVGYLAYALRKKYHLPYVFEVRDLWPDVPLQMAPKLRLIGPWLRQWEKRIYRHAEGIVALSPPMAKAIVVRVPGVPVSTISNFSDSEVFQPADSTEAWRRRWHVPEGHLVVAYTGAVGQANAPDTLVAWLDATAKSKLPVTFLLAGAGIAWPKLETEATKRGWTHVQMLRHRSRDEVADLLAGADVSLVLFKESVPVLGTNSPNKLFDALAAGCAVLTNREGWYSQVLTNTGAGKQLDAEGLVEFFTQVLADKKALVQMQHAARSLAESQFEKSTQLENWRRFLEQCGLH